MFELATNASKAEVLEIQLHLLRPKVLPSALRRPLVFRPISAATPWHTTRTRYFSALNLPALVRKTIFGKSALHVHCFFPPLWRQYFSGTLLPLALSLCLFLLHT